MAIKINFDKSYNAEYPTFILSTKKGNLIGTLPICNLQFEDALNSYSEARFDIFKSDMMINEFKSKLWDEIRDFKLIWVKEWNSWFEIKVDTEDGDCIKKNITATSLGEAELSQINLYNIEINTETDIERDDYEPTILFDESNHNASLLHRIMEKIPHYHIAHVDISIAKIQRTFSFDGKSIYDALQEISKEINCLFIIRCYSDNDGAIIRDINVYDLESYCIECGNRGEFEKVCDKCNSKNILDGYGKDTTIFVSSENLADNITLTTDTGSVKNCFKLEAGDDLMTATIRNCNPNGTDYIWYFSNLIKSEMSKELSDKIDQYDILYNMYQKEYTMDFSEVSNLFSKYNALVEKYKVYNDRLEKISLPIIGYQSLMNAYYNTIDLAIYLQSSLMPTVEMIDTNAENEIRKLTIENLSPVSVSNIDNISISTANNAVLSMAKTIINPQYKIKVSTSNINTEGKWVGSFIITNYSNEDDSATSEAIEITINDHYDSFVRQKIQKVLNNSNTDDLSISNLFDKPYEEFTIELKRYSLNYLNLFYNACQSCIDILVEQGIADKSTWSGKEPNLYDDLYLHYLNKLSIIESEIKLRQDEINLIIGVYNIDNELDSYGIQILIEKERGNIQKVLNLQNYLGIELWLEFCSFRREDVYSNDNYISDGLNNSELFDRANQFFQTAQKEIYKSAELQHSISANLKNLLTMKDFSPIVKYFEVGNWLRIKVDNNIYKLRLIKYSIDYNNSNNISVEFSDVVQTNSDIKSIQNIISQASSMATSYGGVQRQAQQGEKSNCILNDWLSNGLNATNTKIIGGNGNQTQTWDEHGMLFRKYDPISDTYDNVQLRIINSTIAITDDNWNTVKTAIGNCYYHDPINDELKCVYGINGEVIVGKLLIGENLSIYNESGNLTFNDEGFTVTNNINTISINPNFDSIFNIKNKDTNIFSFDENGNLMIMGNIAAQSLTLLDGVNIESSKITGLSFVAVSGDYKDLINTPSLSNIAISGSYNDLIDAPKLSSVATSGDYNELINKPMFSKIALSGNYNDLSGAPIFSKVAISGSYNDLTDTPDISSIETNTQSIINMKINIENIMSQIEALNNAVFNGG